MNDQTTSLPPMGAGNVEPERSTSTPMGTEGSQYGYGASSVGAGTGATESHGFKAKAGETFSQGKEQAKKLGSQARSKAVGLADERKGEVSSKLSVIADSLDQFCSELDSKGVPAQQILGSATSWLRQFSSDLDTQSTEELLARVETRFRRSPAPFLAGCFALGFFGARLLRS